RTSDTNVARSVSYHATYALLPSSARAITGSKELPKFALRLIGQPNESPEGLVDISTSKFEVSVSSVSISSISKSVQATCMLSKVELRICGEKDGPSLLLMFVGASKFTPSDELVKNISSLPGDESGHAMYTSLPETAIWGGEDGEELPVLLMLVAL